MRLSGKSAFITGAGRGIGLAIANTFAAAVAVRKHVAGTVFTLKATAAQMIERADKGKNIKMHNLVQRLAKNVDVTAPGFVNVDHRDGLGVFFCNARTRHRGRKDQKPTPPFSWHGPRMLTAGTG